MNPVEASGKKSYNKSAPKGTVANIVFEKDVMGNKLWDFVNDQYKTKTIYETIYSYDVASVHLQSTTTKPDTSSRPTTPVAPKLGPSGAETSNQGTKPKPKPKVLFVKQAPLSPQGNKPSQSTSKTEDTIPNDNMKRCKCHICEGLHTNLVFCPKLPLYIPLGSKSVTLPTCLCVVCLFTGFENGMDCRHNAVALWMHYMLCPSCPRHEVGQLWWRKYHNP